jgi:ABC-type branched-subunit amino acid transport system substrate-binding protein
MHRSPKRKNLCDTLPTLQQINGGAVMSMKRVLLIAATFLMVPGLSLAAPAKKVKLGFVNSITGPEAPIGENLSNGVTLALEDL